MIGLTKDTQEELEGVSIEWMADTSLFENFVSLYVSQNILNTENSQVLLRLQ